MPVMSVIRKVEGRPEAEYFLSLEGHVGEHDIPAVSIIRKVKNPNIKTS